MSAEHKHGAEHKKTILLVEDGRVLAESEKTVLEKLGYRVVAVDDGEDAVSTVRENLDLDLVLMDINLGSGMDGTEAAEKILEIRDIPIVFLTSYAEGEVVEKTEKISSYGYVLKNAGIPVLDTSIKMAFRLHDAYKALEKSERFVRESEQAVRKKLDAILSPKGDIGALELSDIIDTGAIQALMDEFYRLTGIGVAVVDTKGKILIATGWQEICTKFHRVHPETRAHCIESDTVLGSEGDPGKYRIYKCKNNMWDISTPIIVGEKQVGSIFLGQFFFEGEEPDYDTFREQARKYGFNEEEYLQALDRVPRWSRRTVDYVMKFYSRLADLISKLSYSNFKLARSLEEHKRAEDKVEKLLDEKEMILNEVHHRIKNNLNTIMSLLSLQMNEIDDPSAKSVLADASGRIRSMMVLYNELYRSEQKEAISLRSYLPPLVHEIIGIFPDSVSVNIHTDIDDIVLSPEKVSPLGILMNELLTNTMKYAFSGLTSGEITIAAKKHKDRVYLEYQDSGPGLPENIDTEKSPGFGLQLMEMLAAQLDGSLRIERGETTTFNLEFAP
ncbi:MAG: PocR ligand-binding domain-containing protein [Spirochaetia bacterium]